MSRRTHGGSNVCVLLNSEQRIVSMQTVNKTQPVCLLFAADQEVYSGFYRAK